MFNFDGLPIDKVVDDRMLEEHMRLLDAAAEVGESEAQRQARQAAPRSVQVVEALPSGTSWPVGATFRSDGTVFRVHRVGWSPEHNVTVAWYFDIAGDEHARTYHYSTLEEVKTWLAGDSSNDDAGVTQQHGAHLGLGSTLRDIVKENELQSWGSQELRLLDWHISNIEYSTGAHIDDLSLR
jgi:hypothetical protein